MSARRSGAIVNGLTGSTHLREDLHIRDANEADLSAIVAIYNATVPTRMVTAELTPTTVEARQTWFRAHDASTHPIWVATLHGRVAAWLTLSPFITRAAYRHTAEISVYVAEDFRKRGIGSQLLERAIKNGPGLGLEVLVGNIFAHNIPSLHLFEQHGFERWGLFPRVARLDGIARDLVVVGRHLA